MTSPAARLRCTRIARALPHRVLLLALELAVLSAVHLACRACAPAATTTSSKGTRPTLMRPAGTAVSAGAPRQTLAFAQRTSLRLLV